MGSNPNDDYYQQYHRWVYLLVSRSWDRGFFRGSGWEFEDLVQEAWVKVLKARGRYDPARGKPTTWIAANVLLALKDLRNDRMKVIRTTNVAYANAQKRGDERALRLLEVAEKVVALGAVRTRRNTLNPEGSGDVEDREHPFDPADEMGREEDLRDLEAALGKLSPRNRDVLDRTFGLGGREKQTMAEIAKEMGKSRERVRQMKEAALKRLAVHLTRGRRVGKERARRAGGGG